MVIFKSQNPTFNEWLTWAFDHPILDKGWWFGDDIEWLEPAPMKTVAYLTKVFEDPATILANFSDGQINQGLWFIAHNACSSHMFAVIDDDIALEDRITCVRSFYFLYEKLFVNCCSPTLSHLSEHGEPLNEICYMWWDLVPICGQPDQPLRAKIDQEILKVMSRTLQLKSDACREGALHGLGHWHEFYPRLIEDIIDNFLQDNPNLRPELARYAASAKTGKIN